MFTRCLFCHKPFPENGRIARLPLGRRIAFDPVQGRLWTVCEGCHRWNLCPIEHREAALYELEKLARDHATPLSHTANVELLQAGSMTLIRVGSADRVEQAWWRYGRELRKRKASFDSPRSRVTAYTFGALATLGDLIGYNDGDVAIDWEDTPVADVLRWRRFGWAAWHGRETCPYCNSTLVALRYDLSWWVYPLRGADGRVGVGIPCQRCDPWTPDKVYELHGDVAENTLRRVLAYQNITGASERKIVEAAQAIEHAGSAGEFALESSSRRQSLWKMGPTGTIALEIAVNETAERRMLDLEVRQLEFLWRREEELASIIDRELTPRRMLEAHLRHLPIKIRPRVAGWMGARALSLAAVCLLAACTIEPDSSRVDPSADGTLSPATADGPAVQGAAGARGPRTQPGTGMGIYAPDQHADYDGRFVLSAGRVYQVGGLEDAAPWDHMGDDAADVHAVGGVVEVDVDERANTGTFRAALDLPEGRYEVRIDGFEEFSPCQDGGIAAWLFEHGDSGCGDGNWPKSILYVAGWGWGSATLDGRPLRTDAQIHFMVTQGMRDRETLRVRSATGPTGAGAVNPAQMQLDFYVRSTETGDANHPKRAVFDHFFAMEVTWK